MTAIPNHFLMDRAAEAAVLGSMIFDSACIPSVLGQLTPESFAFEENRTIFNAILAVWRRNPGGALDGLLLRAELEGQQELESVGGRQYLKDILESVPSSANVTYYAGEVVNRQRYRAAVAAVEAMRGRLDNGGNVEDIIQDIQSAAMALESRQQAQSIYDVAKHATAVALQTQNAPCVIPTGFRDVDKLIGGISPGDLVYLAARPSIGKTAFACGWAINAAGGGKRVVFCTLEMTARALMERMSATLGNVSLSRIKRPNSPQDVLDSFYEGAMLLSKLPVVIVENAVSVEKMAGVVRQLKQAGPVDVVILDYIGLMSAGSGRRSNRNEQVSEISRGLKRLAQGEHLPVIVLAQLNRECESRENHRPRMSDLRDSGSQEQDADNVLLLHREDYYRKLEDPETTDIDGMAEVIVGKSRNGPTGIATLVFIEDETRFANVSHVEEGTAGGAAEVEGGGATRFDPDNDPDLQDEYSHRDPNNPDEW